MTFWESLEVQQMLKGNNDMIWTDKTCLKIIKEFDEHVFPSHLSEEVILNHQREILF